LSANLIETLAALQEIDRRNRERQLEIVEIERKVAEVESALSEKQAYVEASRADFGGVALRRRELEALLQEEERKIKERRMRLNRIRNEHELQAAQREIELNKEANSRLEDELLTLLEQGESAEGGLREAEKELIELQAEATRHREQGAKRARQLRVEIDSEQGQREQVAGQLSVSVRRKYEQIFTRRDGVAVVEVRRGCCLGCKMNVPPQLCIEIQKGRDIHVCPSCNRILYWRPEAETAEAG
jgi:predicted  nucleic acid-binding Zn-ribbon protein